MTIPPDILQPKRPAPEEPFNYVSVRSYDPMASACLASFFLAFTTRYAGEDPLQAFFEWILIQLQETPSAKKPFVFAVGPPKT